MNNTRRGSGQKYDPPRGNIGTGYPRTRKSIGNEPDYSTAMPPEEILSLRDLIVESYKKMIPEPQKRTAAGIIGCMINSPGILIENLEEAIRLNEDGFDITKLIDLLPIQNEKEERLIVSALPDHLKKRYEMDLTRDQRKIEKINETLRDINKMLVDYSTPLFKIFLGSFIGSTAIRIKARELLTESLIFIRFFDLYYKTGDKDFLDEGQRYKFNLYNVLNPQYRSDLLDIEKKIVIPFFNYEAKLGEHIKEGKIPEDSEIRMYLYMKSSNALFYAKVIEPFIMRDISSALHVYTELFNIEADCKKYEDDLNKGFPNVLYMLLMQRTKPNKIPQIRENAIELAKQDGTYNWIRVYSAHLVRHIESPFVTKTPSIKRAIYKRAEEIEKVFN